MLHQLEGRLEGHMSLMELAESIFIQLEQRKFDTDIALALRVRKTSKRCTMVQNIVFPTVNSWVGVPVTILPFYPSRPRWILLTPHPRVLALQL